MACLLRMFWSFRASRSASASVSDSEPKARMPWTSSGSTASSCGMCGITNERTLRLPCVPRVPGAPTGCVGSRFSTPLISSMMIVRVRTPVAGIRFNCSSRP
jgi:hypothetical protein